MPVYGRFEKHFLIRGQIIPAGLKMRFISVTYAAGGDTGEYKTMPRLPILAAAIPVLKTTCLSLYS